MKKYIYPMALVAALATTTACSDDDDVIQNIPDELKEKISFSLSDESAVTRAGFTGADTRIVCRIQSDADGKSSLYTRTVLKATKDNTTDETALLTSYSKVSYYTTDNTRFWDDAYGRAAKLSVYAVAIPNSTSDSKLKESKLAGGSTWASEGTPNNSIQWDVTTSTQTDDLIKAEDLVYSNNIQNGGKNGRYVWDFEASTPGYPADNGRLDGHEDGQLKFTQKDGAQPSDAGHFDKGHLMFNHALSRLTITLVEGTGFNSSSDADFQFKKNTGNIKLLSFPISGTLDIQAGSWSNYSSSNINQMKGVAATASATALAAGTFEAQMLPSYKFYGTDAKASDNVMEFVIDDNTYYVTKKMVYDALNVDANKDASNPLISLENDTNGDYIEMKQGKNYLLTITVNKTKIENVTATLAEWIPVSGSTSVNNAHITLSLKTSGETCGKDIDLYRLDEENAGYDANIYDFSYVGTAWFGNYGTDAKHKTTLLQTAKKGAEGAYYWETPWFFESNKTYYHFRTVNKGTEVKGNTGSDADATKDYFEIEAGPIANTDPHWGAPMKSTTTTWLKYDIDNGYEAHLNPAIGATEDQIKIQELHMMSNINVVLRTPNNGGKVTLKDSENKETIVKITRLAKKGTVEMGRGLVTPLAPVSPDTYNTTEVKMTNPTDFWKTTSGDFLVANAYSYAVVPQSLSRNFSSDDDADYVGIFIQTPDNNQYYVVKKLSEILATTVTDQRDQTQGQKILRWYPGHTYTYTITISKKGIENITCTVADWVDVTADNINIDLES